MVAGAGSSYGFSLDSIIFLSGLRGLMVAGAGGCCGFSLESGVFVCCIKEVCEAFGF